MSTNTNSSAVDTSSGQDFLLNNANSSIIQLLSGQQAVEQLQTTDDFISNLSTFDLQARLNSPSATVQDYFEFIKQHVLDWNERASQCIASCVDFINTTCINQVKLLTFPSRIVVILTDGRDESDAAYCRNENVIVIPQGMIDSPQIRKTFIHELFHIWSKWNTNLEVRDELYASIGYHKIPDGKPVALPASLRAIKITNPDAPIALKYYINLKKRQDPSGKAYKCTPVLYAARLFDPNFSTNFFNNVVATTLILDDHTYEPLPSLEYLAYTEASNFFEQVGDNTGYIIHPEEILAENFVLWMTDANNRAQLKTPAVVSRMNEIISNAASGTRATS